MRHRFPNQEGGHSPVSRSMVLILVLAVASSALSSQASSTTQQAQASTKKAPEKKSTEAATCYAVQVGAYVDRAEADRMLNKLMKVFPNGMTISQVTTRNETRWRLRVLATSKPEALKIAARLLRDQDIKAWIDPVPCS